MLLEYVEAALAKAHYEIIEGHEPYYGQISALKGVWATGGTLEDCRSNLRDVVDGWIVVRLQRGLPIPSLGKHRIVAPKRLKVGT